MIFKQFFDDVSSTLTYLLADSQTREAVLIDPVDRMLDVYLDALKAQGLHLKYALETHVHADHITASGRLRQMTQAQTGVSALCGAPTANLQLQAGDELSFGPYSISVIATPGHTAGSLSYYCENRVFTGDTLLINGCGRTDFQSGDAGTLYDSITQKLFSLPDETLVYPAHDYQGRRVSCISQEKNTNQRLLNQSRASFIALMRALNLPKPSLIDQAVPVNRKCGVDEETVKQG